MAVRARVRMGRVAKMHVKKGDTVEVISGEDRGRQGKILEVRPREGRVIVEGINIQKRHTRPTRANTQGGVIEQPGPLAAAKVLLVCPHCKRGVRTGRKRTDNGVVRVCKRCGRDID